MDILKSAKDKYKLGTSVVDMAVVLTNKAMELVNSKVLTNAERVNKELSGGNMDKAKRMGVVYVEMLKNYMTIVSTLNLLVADSHSANYERKMILRKLLRSIESKSTDNSEYILAKIISFEKHISSAAQHIATLSHAIKPVSGGGSKNKNKNKTANKTETVAKPESPVRDLSGVATILMSMGKKIEMSLAEIKLVNKSVLKLVAKKGSYENMRTDEFDSLHSASRDKLVKGGVEVNNKRRPSGKVKILGGAENDEDAVYIGGSTLAQDMEVKAVWVESYKHDKLAMRDNPNYTKLINKKLLDVFKVGSAEELVKVAELPDAEYVERITDDCKLDELLQKQINVIMSGGKLQRFLAYYVKHRNQYAPSKTELKSEAFAGSTFTALALKDDYINLNLLLTENSTTDEKLQYIVDFVKIVMGALNKVDIQSVVIKSNIHFARINDIKTSEQLDDTMDALDEMMDHIKANADLLVERKRLKIEILKHADDVIENSGIFTIPDTAVKGTNEIGELSNHLLEKQLNFRHILGGVEQTCNDQANTLAELIHSIDMLISPDNKDPCVCKAISFVNALTYIEVLPQLLKSRFKSGSEKIKRLEKHREYLADKAKLPTIYTKRLETEGIRNIAAQLVDPEK
jgi:hypothetical protein